MGFLQISTDMISNLPPRMPNFEKLRSRLNQNQPGFRDKGSISFTLLHEFQNSTSAKIAWAKETLPRIERWYDLIQDARARLHGFWHTTTRIE